MSVRRVVSFPPFRVDLDSGHLWREAQQLLPLRPKNFAVLRYLVERVGQIVPAEEFIQGIWRNYPGAKNALKQSIFQLRRVLGDDATNPKFIEAVGQRGYRFIAPIKWGQEEEEGKTSTLVGREKELQQLRELCERAQHGKRQIVFISGEPGIGKTTLVDAFIDEIESNPTVWVGRGQCIEHYGQGEPYLPVLDALGHLSRRAGIELFVKFFARHAPTWLMQMPALLDSVDIDAIQRKTQGATRERMLREFVEAAAAFTTHAENQPPPLLVLVLEDLHWGDYSTFDLLSALARRSERARLLVIGTYRPEGLVEGHPLRTVTQELRGHGQCKEIELKPLDVEAVETYIEKRFPASVLPTHLPEVFYRLTGGNPLFLATVVDDLIDRKVLVQENGGWVLQSNIEAVVKSIPENIRQLVSRQIERLSGKEQRILEAASVAGLKFSAATVAAAVGCDVAEVEADCNALVRWNHFLHFVGQSEWPDGTMVAYYGFRHALYQYLWQERVPSTQQRRIHLCIGECQEAAYKDQVREIAAELAVHFERGKDYQRAITYFQKAAQTALRRSASQEAVAHLTKALELLRKLPETPTHPQQELSLQATLGPLLNATKGWSAEETVRTYNRALELCEQVGNSKQIFSILLGVWGFRLVRGEHQVANAMADRLLQLAQQLQITGLQVEANWASGISFFFLGEFIAALQRFESGSALYDRQQHHALTVKYGQDPEVSCLCYSGIALWCLGYPDQAKQKCYASLSVARELAHPFSLAWALTNVSIFHFLCREWGAVVELAQEGIALCTPQGFMAVLRSFQIFQRIAMFMQGQGTEQIPQIYKKLTSYRALGHEMYIPWDYTILAESCAGVGKVEEGLALLTEGFTAMERTEERFYEAEMYRVKGELTLLSKRKGKPASRVTKEREISPNAQSLEAETYFLKAVEVARRQNAKSFELRAAMSLSRLWRQQGKKDQAKHMLSEIVDWFTEGFATEDLRQAKALLAELT